MDECQGGDTTGQAARVLIEDVHDAISDLVELIKTFQSKNKLSRLFMSTLFKRRQDELDAVVDRAITRLQVSELPCSFQNDTFGGVFRPRAHYLVVRNGVSSRTLTARIPSETRWCPARRKE